MSDCSEDKSDSDFSPCGVEMKQLPPVVQGRVKALKNIQMDIVKAEADYYREVHLLDVRYQGRYDEVNARRAKVISGAHEPCGPEIDWPSDEEEEGEEEDPEVTLTKKVEALTLHPDFPTDSKGIPKFWLHVLKSANEEALYGAVEPHDEDALAHLTDLTVALTADNTGFTLTFHFGENSFFTNKELTKEYILRDGPNPDSPLGYEGPEIVSCKGCSIDWKDGQDLTTKTMKVKTISGKKGKGGSPTKAITKEIKADSFFSFFSPPVLKEDGELANDEDKALLAVDFDVGFAIKEKVIPRAILYFTGEIFGDDDEDFEDCDEEEEDDAEEA